MIRSKLIILKLKIYSKIDLKIIDDEDIIGLSVLISRYFVQIIRLTIAIKT